MKNSLNFYESDLNIAWETKFTVYRNSLVDEHVKAKRENISVPLHKNVYICGPIFQNRFFFFKYTQGLEEFSNLR